MDAYDTRIELERKVYDAVIDTAERVLVGDMSAREGEISLRSIWNVVSGLVPHESLDLLHRCRLSFQAELQGK